MTFEAEVLGIGKLGTSPADMVVGVSGEKKLIKSLILHNTLTSDLNVILYLDDGKTKWQFFNSTLTAKQTLPWDFIGDGLVIDHKTIKSLKGKASKASAVTWSAHGAKE